MSNIPSTVDSRYKRMFGGHPKGRLYQKDDEMIWAKFERNWKKHYSFAYNTRSLFSLLYCESTVDQFAKSSFNFKCAQELCIVTLSMMAGLSWIVTVAQRLSKRPLVLWMKRGWSASSSLPDGFGAASPGGAPGTHPRRAINWQPLQTPKLQLSSLHHSLPLKLCISKPDHLDCLALVD